jgi:hypothetical protein
VVSGVAVSNPSKVSYGNLTITDFVAPATNISLLGEIAGSAQHETWAYGYTTAPPAIVGGAPLPYTVPGANQLVLLRYTDAGGWQIADVLRNADGSAYRQTSGAALELTGQMNPSGEAWLVMRQQVQGQPTRVGVFHRAPGGQFLLDVAASVALLPILSSNQPAIQVQLRLGQSADGTAYGLLVAPGQASRTLLVPNSNGVNFLVTARLDYGVLGGGVWTRHTASLPPGYVPSAGDSFTLAAADATGPGAGWAGLQLVTFGKRPGVILASFDATGWRFVTATGLDALDATGNFAVAPPVSVFVQQIRADSAGIWVLATVGVGGGSVVARIDGAIPTIPRRCQVRSSPRRTEPSHLRWRPVSSTSTRTAPGRRRRHRASCRVRARRSSSPRTMAGWWEPTRSAASAPGRSRARSRRGRRRTARRC